MLLSSPSSGRTPSPPDPEQGVIEEARRRRDARRARAFASLVAMMLLGTVVWALLSTGPPASSSVTEPVLRGPTLSSDTAPGFNIRVWPTLTVGRAGWCMVVEEHGRAGVSACGGPATTASPFVEIFGFGPAATPSSMTMYLVSTPQVAAVLVDGHLRRDTAPLPGLPYGLRAARISNALPGMRVVALDARGHAIADTEPAFPPKQAAVRSWRYPERPPHGTCELQATGISGLATRGGAVATAIAPRSGQLVGHAFLACLATEYRLHGTPLKAILLLDAAQPGTRVAALPNFHPVGGAPGIFAEGELTAKRSGPGWMVVEQGSTPAQRILLLEHLTASART